MTSAWVQRKFRRVWAVIQSAGIAPYPVLGITFENTAACNEAMHRRQGTPLSAIDVSRRFEPAAMTRPWPLTRPHGTAFALTGDRIALTMHGALVCEARGGRGHSFEARLVRLVLAIGLMVGVYLESGEVRALDVRRSLSQIHHTAWTLRDGMPAYVSALAQTSDGYLWVGASSGLYRFDGIHLEPFQQKLPGGAVLALAATPSGDLWIGSSTGISRLSHGRLETFHVPGLGPPNGVTHIALGRNGDVWIASEKVARFDGRRWQVMNSEWGTSENYRKPGGVWALAVARDGVVWTKNLLGLYFLRPGSTQFVRADGYGGGIIDFASDADGRLWTADIATRRFYALRDLEPAGPASPPAQVVVRLYRRACLAT